MDLVKVRDEAFIDFVKTGSLEKVNKDKAKLKCKELGFNPFNNCAFLKGDRK